jgi:hypothetical protein
MNSLFEGNNPQVEILNFQTFSTEYVAERYGVSTTAIREHKRLHADEMLECVHFVIEINKFRKPVIKWTLRGIIKLGMFIRSEKAKGFRLWAEQELEKAILKQVQAFAEAREHNLRLVDEISNLRAVQISQGRHNQNVINGYKSQLSQRNALIAKLRATPTGFKDLYLEASAQRDYFRRKYNEIYELLKFDKGERITIALAKIQKELERVYSGIGAVMAYANEGDRYFLEHNEITKG